MVKLFVLDNGRLDMDLAWMILNPKAGTVDNKHPQADWISIPTYTVLIEHPDLEWFLYDGTCHPEWEDRWPQELQPAFPLHSRTEAVPAHAARAAEHHDGRHRRRGDFPSAPRPLRVLRLLPWHEGCAKGNHRARIRAPARPQGHTPVPWISWG